MTIQEAMQKATEGGYHIHGSDGAETFKVTGRPRTMEARPHESYCVAPAIQASQQVSAVGAAIPRTRRGHS